MKIDYNDYDPRYRMSWAMGIMQRYDSDHGDPEEAAKEICQLCDAHMIAHKPAEAKTEAEGLTNPTPAHAPQPVGEWFTLDMMSELCDSKYGHGKKLINLVKGDFDRVLTEHYGHPPIVRTYNGEPASEWGLMEESTVLVWVDKPYAGESPYWSGSDYECLERGDRWMMQPKSPD